MEGLRDDPATVNTVIAREASAENRPLRKSERIWSGWDFTWVNLSLAIATWAFLTGGATVLLVGFAEGLAAMVIGQSIGLGIMLLGSVILSQRLGVEQYRTLRTVFGTVGVAIMVLTVVLITEMGWSSLLGVMFGRAFAQITNQVFGTELASGGTVVVVFALLAILGAWILLSRGPLAISKINRFVGPGLLVVVAFMMIMIMTQHSWDDLLAAQPIDPFEDERMNFAIAIEFNLGTGLSWWPVMGALARLTRSPKAAVWPAFGGLFIGTLVASACGMAAALLLGDSDPTSWMVPLGGPVLGVLTLLFIGFANVTSTASIAYSTVLALKLATGRLLDRVRWPVLCAMFLALPAVASCFPDFMMGQFMTFVSLSGAFIAAICGVIIADSLVLRRQSVSLRGLYSEGHASPYRFHGGVNIAAALAVAIGTAVYLWIYNPVTFATQDLIGITTASLPATIAAGLVYLPLCWFFNLRTGKGGYRVPDTFR